MTERLCGLKKKALKNIWKTNQEISDTEYEINICYPNIIYSDAPDIEAKIN